MATVVISPGIISWFLVSQRTVDSLSFMEDCDSCIISALDLRGAGSMDRFDCLVDGSIWSIVCLAVGLGILGFVLDIGDGVPMIWYVFLTMLRTEYYCYLYDSMLPTFSRPVFARVKRGKNG